jgi:branched-subunit amino acid transport protein
MSDIVPILAIGIVLYAMKALPFAWHFVPRTPLADQIIDLLPVALLAAVLLPPVLAPLLAGAPATDGLVSLLAVAASFVICLLSNRTAVPIAVGLAILAMAEFF